jgi:type II secretory pathway component PulC
MTVMIDELLSPLLTTSWGRRLGLSVLVIMVIVTFILLIQTFSMWRSDFNLTKVHVSQNENFTEASDRLAKQIMQLPDWHLFGKYGVTESAILPVTSLQIRLIGVIKSTPDQFSRVIISESNQPGKIYSVGDVLSSSGVKIYAITSEGVVLDNSGRLEKLPLQRTPLMFQGMPKSLGE